MHSLRSLTCTDYSFYRESLSFYSKSLSGFSSAPARLAAFTLFSSDENQLFVNVCSHQCLYENWCSTTTTSSNTFALILRMSPASVYSWTVCSSKSLVIEKFLTQMKQALPKKAPLTLLSQFLSRRTRTCSYLLYQSWKYCQALILQISREMIDAGVMIETTTRSVKLLGSCRNKLQEVPALFLIWNITGLDCIRDLYTQVNRTTARLRSFRLS